MDDLPEYPADPASEQDLIHVEEFGSVSGNKAPSDTLDRDLQRADTYRYQ